MIRRWRSNTILLAPLALLFFVGGFMFAEWAFTPSRMRIVETLSDTLVLSAAERPIYSYGYAAGSVYDRAYDVVGSVPSVDSGSAIVAHHLLAAADIARVFEAIGSGDIKTVVVISPNHFSSGKSPAQISFGTWRTPYGDLATDITAARELLAGADILKREESTFVGEHGIAAITPFIKRSFPNAGIIAIAVHETLTPDEARSIGDAIATELSDAVVITSIDMSHYLPSYAADYHDGLTIRAIEAGAMADGLELEIDSNASLRILQRINKIRGNTAFHLTAHTGSLCQRMDGECPSEQKDAWKENTSHILGFFVQPEQKEGVDIGCPSCFAGVHILGDVMLDRDVRKLMDTQGVGAPWENVERFLMGSHLRVGNLEGTVNERAPKYTYRPPFEFNFTPKSVAELAEHIDLVSLANNHSQDNGVAGEVETRNRLDDIGLAWFGSYHATDFILHWDVNGMPLTFVGFNVFTSDERAVLDEIRTADGDGRFVIVMPHWGVEYASQTSSQRRVAEKMVDAGADLIVGGHPHVIQGIDIINTVPVIYSLGNFIFDQRFRETTIGLTAGVIIDDDGITLHLLPIATNNGKPSPLSDERARDILEAIAAQSPINLRDQIRSGVINVSYE